MNSIPFWVGITLAITLGAIIGSFLNACIHRMPRGISLSNPRRSFCPDCQTPIPWYYNLPIVSYLWLRGRCAFCGKKIPLRYWVVEVLTAGVFLALWQLHGLPLAPAYWLLAALLIAATFIDIDHLIIPDEITLGGTAAGVLLCLLIPEMMGTTNRWVAFGHSVLGAATGFFVLFAVVELGKLAFGKKRHSFPSPREFTWRRQGETAEIDFGEEVLPWEEVFQRESDELTVECDPVRLPEKTPGPMKLVFCYDVLRLPDGSTLDLDHLDTFTGKAVSVTIPREAMGFGDVKFLAAIGAFLGWQAVCFTLFASSIVGCLVGVAGMLISRGRSGQLLPFGPFLALGALIWMLGGRAIWDWYFGGHGISLFPFHVR